MDWLEPLRQDTERIRQETQKIREETERIREETQRIREENRKLRESIRKLKKINTQKLLQEIIQKNMTTEPQDKTPEQLFEEILMDRNPLSFMDLLVHPDLDKFVKTFDQSDDLSES